MKITCHGNLETYEKAFARLSEHKADFTVRTRGVSKNINLGSNYGMRFVNSHMAGAFMCGLVKRDIDNYLLKNDVPLVNHRFYNVQYVNIQAIEKIGKAPFACYDANYCYFQTAYNLGYITRKTFKRGIRDKEIKPGLLAAIGGLGSLDFCEDYKGGKLVNKYPDWDKYNRYSPFYWNVITVIWKMMQDCIAEFGDDLYMWLTDCAYINTSREKDLKLFLEKRGYEHKRFMANFEGIDYDKEKLSWYDAKANRVKTMSYFGKDKY